jgi:hypothetical protein
MSCPTCNAIQAVLQAARVPKPAAKALSRSSAVRKLDRTLKDTKAVRRVIGVSARSKKLSKHLKETNAKARKKNGQLKKGWTQQRIMQVAHKCVKKEMRK